MENNQKFISTIKNETDFEELVRRYVSHAFGVEAYLIGGPWDNGKDLVYKIRNKEIKEATQISIQENRLEEKIEADLKKITVLVDEHNYPATLNFFWSHPASEFTLDKIKTKAKKEYGITLEFFDAKRLGQDITNNYPDLLNFLIKDIHKLSANTDLILDIKQRTFYEYLLLSKDSANLKNSITDANILSLLSEGDKTLDEILENIDGISIKRGALIGRLNYLSKNGRIIFNSPNYSLSLQEKIRIENTLLRETAQEVELIELLERELTQYKGEKLATQILDLIKKAYEASVDVQITELDFQPPKAQIIKTIINELSVLITKHCNLDSNNISAEALSQHLVELANESNYLSEHCSAKLCLNLLSNRKLEKYIEEKMFFIYLDAPVLIPYLAVTRFSKKELLDRSLKNVNIMRESINGLKNKKIRATIEHFEETVRHLEQADKISQFATADLINELGGTKNVFLNIYLKWKADQPDRFGFHNFLFEFIGIEDEDIPITNRFDAYAACVHDFLQICNIEIIDYFDNLPTDYLYKVKSKFSREIALKNRAPKAIENDVICSAVLGDNRLHCDDKGYFSTPMIVTLDSTQYELRNVVRSFYPSYEWLVYTPQRAIERLSMLGMKISPSSLKDGVLATISEEYFFKENTTSLIDTLSIIVGDNPAEQGEIVNLITRLKRKVIGENIDQNEIDIEKYNIISQVLLFTHKEFKNEMKKVRKLFSDAKYKETLVDLLSHTIVSGFNEKSKTTYLKSFATLLTKLD
ncbi:hypothetical protein IM286_04925 [Enterobacter cloacae complex sp. P20C]|nr:MULTISPECIES: hypothetical protein [unclassified Enterobacter cloacae complex]MBE3463660.1 hypothetical protein [Enterobacter cloacae complex sp. P20C]MBE3471964.1 hypothetical protein [Enterobacter cloacae complex sp. P20B]MBE3497008.1 hypothetical protein [Enterobacter cloacae complex sp. P17RS]